MLPLEGRLKEIARLERELNDALEHAGNEGYDLRVEVMLPSDDGDYCHAMASQIRIVQTRVII